MMRVCVGICKLNYAQTHCIGCKRSLLEIEQWRDYSKEKKQAIAQELEKRRIQDDW